MSSAPDPASSAADHALADPGTVVIETLHWKVRIIMVGVEVPAGILALCAVLTLVLGEYWGTVFMIMWTRRRRDPRSHLVLTSAGVELPRGRRVFLPWSEITDVSLFRGTATLNLTKRGFQIVHAEEPRWLARLTRLFGKAITLPRQFEVGPARLTALLDAWHQEYGPR